MLSAYLIIKLVHIVSATLLFGTGLGTAFFMLEAHRSQNADAIRVTTRHVVLADWLFTLPAVVVQLGTGIWLVRYLGIAYDSVWLVSVLTLFFVVGCCWLPVVWIQIRLRELAAAGRIDAGPGEYRTLMRTWIALGIPAFLATLVLFALMVVKPGLA